MTFALFSLHHDPKENTARCQWRQSYMRYILGIFKLREQEWLLKMDFFYDVPIDLLEAAKQVSGSLTHILKLEVVSKI